MLTIKNMGVHCTVDVRRFYTVFHSIILISWVGIYKLETTIKTCRRNKDSYVTMMTEFIQYVYQLSNDPYNILPTCIDQPHSSSM